jgi:signal transduction histidine kinase
MVRRIVEAHGSQVSVESIPDQGSRFSFSLPHIQSEQKAKAAFDDN